MRCRSRFIKLSSASNRVSVFCGDCTKKELCALLEKGTTGMGAVS
ncbi:hypothetical protein DRJ53_13660 [Paracnuella aquatica]|nr:hypothetical protein DRJ53_13660 [Paracnuella aquatica]